MSYNVVLDGASGQSHHALIKLLSEYDLKFDYIRSQDTVLL